MSVEHGKKFWQDGRVLDWEASGQVSLLTHTLHYGLGVFEGIRAYLREDGSTTIFRLHEHIVRLFDSAKLVLMAPQCSISDVEAGCHLVLRENAFREGYLRPIMYLGAGAMGLLPTDNPVVTAVMVWKWGAYLGAEGLERGIRCKISSFSRHAAGSALPRGKIIGQYTNSILAKREAKLTGYDEAILLDSLGRVSEGSGENLFVVKGGRISTPPLSASILAGITRDTVITLAKEEGFVVVEEPVTREALYLADEVFLTGTAAEVTPVREVDDRAVGAGKRGEVTRALQERFFQVVRGKDDTHPEWLTRV